MQSFEPNKNPNLVKLCSPIPYKSDFKGRTYWIGYQFNPDIPPKQRSEFIQTVKGLGAERVPNAWLRQFIEQPLIALNNEINLGTFDFFVYPVSGRSPLVSTMIGQIDEWTSHEITGASFGLLKKTPQAVTFDWEKFDRRYKEDGKDVLNRYGQMQTFVTKTLLPSIHAGTYFSIAESVRTKYRPYIMNYLNFSERDAEKLEALRSSKGGTVLIVDDVNTTGSTLNEILRMLAKINTSLQIYVFTLLG